MSGKSKLKPRWARAASIAAGATLSVGAMFVGTAAAWAVPSPAELMFSPSSGAFGQVTPGDSTSLEFTLTNAGHAASSALSVTLTDSTAFSITSDTCSDISLPKSSSCTITVEFSPTSSGSFSGTLSVTGDNNKPGSSASVALSGTGASSAKLYWSTAGYNGTWTVTQSNLDGTDPQQIATGSGYGGGVAADSTNVYWGTASAIWESDLNGDGAHVIVPGVAPRQLAVDTANDHLYWANFGSGMFGTDSTIMEANLDGTDAHTIATFTGSEGVAVSGANLYWTQGYDPYNLSQPYGVVKANLDGSGAVVIAPNLQVFDLAADSSHVYWSGHDFSGNATVTEANLDGSNPQTVGTSGAGGIISGVAVSSTNLYWTDINLGTITMAGLGGSDPSTLFSGLEFPLSVAVG